MCHKRKREVVTSGFKAQASVFNVRGRPCLCVGASGSMKGGSRGHFRHLLLSCTTHPSICVRCSPSVHSHTLTGRKVLALMLRVNAQTLQTWTPVRVFLFCICLVQRNTPVLWPVFLAGERRQTLLQKKIHYLKNKVMQTRQKTAEEGPSRENNRRLKESRSI